jgi:S-DNA-T family DNA segregation ATPase FtsK/SpoIIIE
MSTDDYGDDMGRVLNFRPREQADELASRGDVIDAPPAETNEDQADDQPRDTVMVDQPTPAGPEADRPLLDRIADARADRRPILAPWLRRSEDLAAVLRWAAGHAGHVVAFHAVRVPLYAGRLAWRAPWGVGRLLVRVISWATDAQGQALREHAAERRDHETYLKLKAAQPRGRAGLVVLGVAGLATVTLLVVGFAPTLIQVVIGAGLVAGLGWLGRSADAPILGARAVVSHSAPRLTSDVVVRALGALGLAEVNKTLAKGGNGISFPAPITRDGPGWRAEVDLPYGVTVTDIAERRDRLASGLRRPLGCVWPEPATDEHAGRLVLWVGDQDMARAKPKAWPLSRSGEADVFKPVPFGFDQRGRLVSVLLMFANVLIGAMPRQGKTFALRVLLLACALDPSVQLRVFELKGTGDLAEPGQSCAHHYASGADDETLAAAVASLREVHAELDRRAAVIRDLPRDLCPENKVTPQLSARRSLGLFPIVIAIDECQELFSHNEFGKDAEDLCVPIIKRGPALGIILILATQRPDAKSLPRAISDNVGIRFALRVMGQEANDMILGTSSYRNGTRATMFGPKDKGIGLLAGNADDPQIVRSSYLDGPAAEKISQRARALRAAAGTLSGYAAGETTSPAETDTVSLLADVLAVLGRDEDRVWSETVVDRLAELRPEVYGRWADQKPAARATQLAAALKPYGVDTSQVHGRLPNGKTANRRGITRDDIATAEAHHRPTRPSDAE